MAHHSADATLTGLAPVIEPGSVTIGVAIAIPEPCGSTVKLAREGYGDAQARSIPTHITLLPPAMVSPTMLDGIDEHLRHAAARAKPFRISLHGSATFRPVSPVVFLSLNEGIAGCEALERVVRSGPLLRRRNFPYHPHVTLVHDVPEQALDDAFRDFAEYRFAFEAAAFTLYQQDASQVWQPVRDYALGLG
jgi:2'-5' RNA ligase